MTDHQVCGTAENEPREVNSGLSWSFAGLFKKPPYLALLISAFALISGAVQAFSVARGVSQHICRAAAERPMWNYGCLEAF